MTQQLVKRIQQLINCDPTHCARQQCPLFYNGDVCTYATALAAFEAIIKEKFKDRNKKEEENEGLY